MKRKINEKRRKVEIHKTLLQVHRRTFSVVMRCSTAHWTRG